MLTPFLGGIFGVSVQELNMLVIPIAGIILAGVMAISGMYFKHQKQQLWHETARLALEKGQPLPMYPGADVRPNLGGKRERNDLRGGLILVAVSAGIFVFLRTVDAHEASAVAAIPGFIGIALLILGAITQMTSKGKNTTDDLPRQS